MNEWRLGSFESVSAAIAQGHNDLLDWGDLRRRIKNDSTVIGEAMISQWMKAPSQLSATRRATVQQNLQ
jgi:hypothetical protein